MKFTELAIPGSYRITPDLLADERGFFNRLYCAEEFARAGLIGNPSDGYHGKTISLIVPQFRATAVLYEWDDVELVLSQEDHSRFRSIHELARDVRLHGYYGGIRLIKATIKKFVEYADREGLPLHDRNFSNERPWFSSARALATKA